MAISGRALVVLAGTLIPLASGCELPKDPANPRGIPRLSDAGFIHWLNGQKITYHRGMFGNLVWQIDPGEVSDFKVVRVTANPVDGIYTATVSFRATRYGFGIEVSEAFIRYKRATDEPSMLEFVEFVPVSVTRIGN